MSGIFHRRKASASTVAELDSYVNSLHQQTNENSVLKEKIGDLKDAISKNKQNFESLMKDNEEQEKTIQLLRSQNSELADKIREQEIVLKSLRETKFQLATDKDVSAPQTGSVKKMQDLLDLTDQQGEELIFKDMHNITWVIKKRLSQQ